MLLHRSPYAVSQRMMHNDPKRYRDQIMATTNTYGWNTVTTGDPIPAIPAYPAPSRPHPNTRLPLRQKINTAMNILTSSGLSDARKYVIHMKIPEEYGTHNVREVKEGKIVETQEKYTPEWILARESTRRRMKKEANARNKNMKMKQYLAYSAKGGRTKHMRKTSHKRRRQK
jgi:hypothetical protein